MKEYFHNLLNNSDTFTGTIAFIIMAAIFWGIAKSIRADSR